MDNKEINKQEETEGTRIDRAIQKFADLMIQRLENSKKKDWEQGWTEGSHGFGGLPQNITGRTYVGGNAFLLQVHTSMRGFHVPVYMTRTQMKENGVHIKKGEHSVPVFKWGLNIKDENGKRLSEDAFRDLSKDEQNKCQVRPYLKVFNEWNIDQTTFEEDNNEKYQAILSRFQFPPIKDDKGMYKNEALDRMFDKQEWLCPIQVDQEAKGAVYNAKKDAIVVPMKAQFNIHDELEEIFMDGQEYYSSAMHEMAHSTGHSSRLDRLPEAQFGSQEYAKEELVAETTAFVIGNAMGFSNRISDNNAAYVDWWIQKLREEPKYIVTVMSDVNKASRMILEEIDKQKVKLGEKPLMEGNLDGIEEQLKNKEQFEQIKLDQISQEKDAPQETQVSSVSPAENHFTALIHSIVSDKDSEHTVLQVKSLSELRDYYKEHEVFGSWIQNATDEQLLTAGASLLPNIVTEQNTNKEQNMNDSKNNSHEIKDTQQGKPYYFSYQYLQSTDDTQEFDDLNTKEKWDQLLNLAQEYDPGDALTQSQITKSATSNSGDSLLAENENYAVVYNNSVGGTYELLRRVSENDLRMSIDSYGLEKDASEAVVEVAKNMAEEEMTLKLRDKTPAFTMSNGDLLHFEYNKEKDSIDVGTVSNIGLMVKHSFPYDHGATWERNLDAVIDNLSEMPEYQTVEEEAVMEEKPENSQHQEEQPAHEDSNIQTDVAGKAEQIAHTGVPMHVAEKEAKAISDDEQHAAYHQVEKEAQQDVSPKVSEETAKDEQISTAKAATHASILLGALEMAKSHDGVWMNGKGKSNAEFLHFKKPITPFNNLMMNLNSDLQGYKTNVYTSFNPAKDNDMPVMRGQTSLPFNWTKWEYQNVTNPNDTISKEQYAELSDAEKTNYAIHATRQRFHMYNIDQTVMPANDVEGYGSLVREKGEQIKNFSKDHAKELSAETAVSYVMGQEKKHPDAIILIRNKDFYETYGEKADVMGKVLGLPASIKDVGGKKISYAAFPYHALDNCLPKLIRAGNRIAMNDGQDVAKMSKDVPSAQKILSTAYQTASQVAKSSGIGYERVMVLQDAQYDKVQDKIIVSGMSPKGGNEEVKAILKANDIYRAVVGSTGHEHRLDRTGRNNLLPADDAKHELLVRELTAGVMMARQGLPATFSQESQKQIPYWEREIKENSKLVGILERDVNNALETIDNLMASRKVNYEAIKGELPNKDLLSCSKDFSISRELNKLPSIDTKELVVVMDRKNKTADVILPAGASLQVNNEVPGMNKRRVGIALGKEGIKEVSFYNAGGSLALKQPNSYYKDKEVTVSRLKQYTLLTNQTIDVASKVNEKQETKILKFQAIQDHMGKYAFFIKPENEPSFSVYPMKEHLNSYFSVMGKENKNQMHNALARKYYEMASTYPDSKQELIMPNTKGIDLSRVEKVRITSDKENPKVKVVIATIDGEQKRQTISKQQWYNLWLADDMAAYKKAVAAVSFIPTVNKEVQVEQKNSVKADENLKQEQIPAVKEEKEEVKENTPSRGFHR